MRQTDSDLRVEKMMEGEMMEGRVIVTSKLKEKQNKGQNKMLSEGVKMRRR